MEISWRNTGAGGGLSLTDVDQSLVALRYGGRRAWGGGTIPLLPFYTAEPPPPPTALDGKMNRQVMAEVGDN